MGTGSYPYPQSWCANPRLSRAARTRTGFFLKKEIFGYKLSYYIYIIPDNIAGVLVRYSSISSAGDRIHPSRVVRGVLARAPARVTVATASVVRLSDCAGAPPIAALRCGASGKVPAWWPSRARSDYNAH
jgi:hypothetical protein